MIKFVFWHGVVIRFAAQGPVVRKAINIIQD